MLAPGQSELWKSFALGMIFITLGSFRVLLIKFSANEEGKYDYLPATVNTCAEILKFLICVGLAMQYIFSRYKWSDIPKPSKLGILSVLKWAVPGFLYFVDNLLAFYVVKYLQPALAVLLGNFGIISTSLLFRIILRRKISRVQWAALLILFLAIICLSNQSQGTLSIEHHKHHAVNHLILTQSTEEDASPLHICSSHDTQFQITNTTGEYGLLEAFHLQSKHGKLGPWNFFYAHRGHALILLQCIIASLANVYNEKIFKEGNGLEESIYLQNCKLYAFGIVFNLMSLLVHDVYRQKITTCGFFHGHNVFSIILIFVTALHGLNVALILKFRDNMFHLLSSQLITVIVISASIYFFHFNPKLEFFLTAPIVVTAIYIFQISKYKEEQSPIVFERQRVRFRHDVDEGDGFILSQNPLPE